MKKMKLAVDELAVESFAPAPEPEWRGTVAANQQSGPYTDECGNCSSPTYCGDLGCYSYECPTVSTCDGYQTCAGAYTCDGDTCIYPACTAPGAAC
jgi:hypothetical protein